MSQCLPRRVVAAAFGVLMICMGLFAAGNRPVRATERLRTIPTASVIGTAALPHTVRLMLESREQALERLGRLQPPVRRIVLLQVLVAGWGRDSREGLHTFLFLHGNAGGHLLPEIADALREAGLAGHHRIFVDALALFGSQLPENYRERHRRFAWSAGSGPLNDFDLRLMALSQRFGTRSEFRELVARAAEADPVSAAWITAARDEMTDEDRLRWLVGELHNGLVDTWAPPQVMDHHLAALGEPYRTIFIASAYQREVMNGGMHQFFLNSSGALAPHLIPVMQKLRLPEDADAISRGMAMFPAPYQRETNERRAFMRARPREWSERLNGLGGRVDDGAVQQALIELAIFESAMPR
jgi:hypothetical protein